VASTCTRPTSGSCGPPSRSRPSSSCWWRPCCRSGRRPTVEFKRQLDLATKAHKAGFIRDILALAATKSSGERFLIVGFDDKTHQFLQSVDPAITQNQLEQLLNAYAAPAPEIRYRRVAWDQGDVGVIKVLRDPAKVPYRVNKTLAHISKGDVYVRHGSQVEPPTPAELAALEAQGRAAASTTP
jgi:predicted HTH transcriptional regulator